MTGHEASARPVVVVVDVANVMGSRPDGWWRDRPGAATGLLERMPPLVGRTVDLPDGESAEIHRIAAVVEGRATDATAPAGSDGLAAPADGDTTIADRGLRARLPDAVATAGPGWLNDLIGR
jgi:hypothetical protein